MRKSPLLEGYTERIHRVIHALCGNHFKHLGGIIEFPRPDFVLIRTGFKRPIILNKNVQLMFTESTREYDSTLQTTHYSLKFNVVTAGTEDLHRSFRYDMVNLQTQPTLMPDHPRYHLHVGQILHRFPTHIHNLAVLLEWLQEAHPHNLI